MLNVCALEANYPPGLAWNDQLSRNCLALRGCQFSLRFSRFPTRKKTKRERERAKKFFTIPRVTGCKMETDRGKRKNGENINSWNGYHTAGYLFDGENNRRPWPSIVGFDPDHCSCRRCRSDARRNLEFGTQTNLIDDILALLVSNFDSLFFINSNNRSITLENVSNWNTNNS